jgi:hypothetical protein
MSEIPLERAKAAVEEGRASAADAMDAATHSTSELEQLTGGDARAQSRRTSPDDSQEAPDEPQETAVADQPGEGSRDDDGPVSG